VKVSNILTIFKATVTIMFDGSRWPWIENGLLWL
jgi:hypothetical protein